MFLKNELNQIEAYLKESHQINTKVSSKGIDWHLDHSLKVIIAIYTALKKSDAKTYTWKFNATRTFVLLTGYIPRGKAKAPKKVLPPEKISKEAIVEQVILAKEIINNTTNLSPKSNFNHPYFGLLNLKQTKKFLQLHTKHHLKICADIISQNLR